MTTHKTTSRQICMTNYYFMAIMPISPDRIITTKKIKHDDYIKVFHFVFLFPPVQHMKVWGKIAGGVFGYMIGDALGALVGVFIGHYFDKGLSVIHIGPASTGRVQTAFFTATFSIMGHVAKADGRVSEEEIQMAIQIMTHMGLSTEQQLRAIQLFDEGKHADFDLDEALAEFAMQCKGRRNLIQMFLEIQIATTIADGIVNNSEREVLVRIGDHLNFSPSQIEQLIRMVQAQQHYARGHAGFQGQTTAASIADAYAVMGIPAEASDAEVKKAYRRLMNQHHPDKLVAKGLPEEMMKIATEKTQEIKLAYEQIKQERKL